MSRRIAAGLGGLVLVFALAGAAQAKQVCGWLVEKNNSDNLRQVDLWLQADSEIEFLYQIGGKGLADESGHSHSPGSGTYVLHRGKGERVWGFGATLNPPGTIDIIADLHEKPADIFDDKPTPILASFTFHRDVAENEKTVPRILAKKQCATLK
jgi:hypothetical protein